MLPLAYLGSPVEVGMVVALIAVLFGGSKLAGLGKGLGDGIKEFKKATSEDDKPAAVPVVPAAAYPEPPVSTGSRTEEK